MQKDTLPSCILPRGFLRLLELVPIWTDVCMIYKHIQLIGSAGKRSREFLKDKKEIIANVRLKKVFIFFLTKAYFCCLTYLFFCNNVLAFTALSV